MYTNRWTFLLIFLVAAGCQAGLSVYVHPNADLSTVRQVAILPLENFTNDRFAGERVHEVLTVELLAQGLFDVVESGEVLRIVREQGIATIADLGAEDIDRLGQALGAQSLLLGSVMDFRERRTGSFTVPEVALSLRLLDAETGLVIWSVTDARTGMSIWTRLFGIGEESLTDAVQKLVRELLATLFEEAV